MKKILLGLLCGGMILGISTGCVKQDNGLDTENKKNNSENSDGLTDIEKTRIYLFSDSAVKGFEAAYYQLIFDNNGEPPTLSEVIDEFNNGEDLNNLKANLETKNEILIEETLYDISFKCGISYNQCKFKVICSEKETPYMELRDC